MATAIQPADRINLALSAESVRAQFRNALQDNSGPFIASLIDLYSGDDYLQKSDPRLVVMEALKAATLKLPINKQLGFAYIVPFKGKPTFTIGYKGYIQLAMRSGQYKNLNAGIVYEGIKVEEDLLTGNISFSGERKSDVTKGYFCHMELVNGFSKTLYMSKDDIDAHARRYSPSYNTGASPWKSNFDTMALKTVVRKLLSKYGILSTEMIGAFASTTTDEEEEAEFDSEVEENANKDVLDVEWQEKEEGETQSKETPKNTQAAQQPKRSRGF